MLKIMLGWSITAFFYYTHHDSVWPFTMTIIGDGLNNAGVVTHTWTQMVIFSRGIQNTMVLLM